MEGETLPARAVGLWWFSNGSPILITSAPSDLRVMARRSVRYINLNN